MPKSVEKATENRDDFFIVFLLDSVTYKIMPEDGSIFQKAQAIVD